MNIHSIQLEAEGIDKYPGNLRRLLIWVTISIGFDCVISEATCKGCG